LSEAADLLRRVMNDDYRFFTGVTYTSRASVCQEQNGASRAGRPTLAYNTCELMAAHCKELADTTHRAWLTWLANQAGGL